MAKRMLIAALATTTLLAGGLAGCAARQERVAEATGQVETGKTKGSASANESAHDSNASIIVTATRVEHPARMDVPTSVQTIFASPSAPPPPPGMVAPAPMLAGKSVRDSRYMWVPPVVVPTDPGTERYDGKDVSPVHLSRAEPVSTFSIDVDTGAYANARRFLTSGQLPPKDAVRTEEMINYFRYAYPLPEKREAPFSVTTDMAVTPWNPQTRLLRVGLRGYDLPRAARPPANLVFLVDVSGSMNEPDKLPLVKTALEGLANELGPQDRVSIVVYAGAAGLVLPPTGDKAEIRAALEHLSAGGSTAGGAGLQLAYEVARGTFIKEGINRVLLATDGDFNVGVSDTKALLEMIEKQRDSGITLTTLGFGQGNYNEGMMEQIADHGNGNYAYIDTALEARKVLAEQMSSTLFTIAGDVKIQVEFNPAAISQYRLVGYENRALREEDFNNDKVDAGEIGAGHQVTAIYEVVPTGAPGWIGPRRYNDPFEGNGVSRNEVAFVKLRYKLPGESASKLIERAVPGSLMAAAGAPKGDMAFAVAVAAFGQKLRGDPMLAGYDWKQVTALAGDQGDYSRAEFVKLVSLAGSLAQP